MECTSCRHVVPVPMATGVQWDADQRMPLLPFGVLALEVKFLCSGCGAKLRIDARWEGREVTCPHCRQITVVPQWSRGPTPGARPGAPPAVSLSEAEIEFLSEPVEPEARRAGG